MARSGSNRGMLRVPRRRRGSFATFMPGTGTTAASPLRRVAEYSPGGSKKKAAGWQADALSYYESLPPVGFVMDFKANTVAACDLNVVQRTNDGLVPVENNDQVDRLMASLVGPRGGTAELIRRAAVLVEVTGEAYFVGTPIDDEAEAVWWEFLSVEELLLPDMTPGATGKYRRDYGLGGEKEELPDEAFIARFWRSDARYSARPSCGLRRCLSTCRELELLSRMTEAIIASRLPMGLLLVPSTIEHESPLARRDDAASQGDNQVGDDESSFMNDLIDHMSTPITDFESASTLVPLVVMADREDLESIKVVDLARSLDQYASGLREEMYGRLAVGMDIPPEILQGKGGLNHWTGSNIDNEFLFKHVQPVGNLVADFLTYAYLRPLLQAEGMPLLAASQFSIEFDASPLSNNEDDHLKAKTMWDQRLVSDRAVIEKQGWDPDQVMPEDDERIRRLVETMVLTKVVSLSAEGAKYLKLDPEWFALSDPHVTPEAPFGEPPNSQPADPATPGAPGVPTGPAADRPGQQPDQPGTPQKPAAADKPTSGDQPPQRAAASGLPQAEKLVQRLGVLADCACSEARRRAASRIIRASSKVPAFKGRFASTPTVDVPAAVTTSDLAVLRLTVAGCLAGDTWTDLREHAYCGLAGLMIARGVDEVAAADAAGRIVGPLVDDLNRWLVEGFHRPFGRYTDSAGEFKVPAETIEAAVGLASSRPTLRAV